MKKIIALLALMIVVTSCSLHDINKEDHAHDQDGGHINESEIINDISEINTNIDKPVLSGEELSANYKVMDKAYSLQDEIICNEIKDGSMKIECKDSVSYAKISKILDSAYEKWDVKICEQIQVATEKKSCIENVNNSLDYKIENEAVLAGDDSLCSKIKNKDTKEMCKNSVKYSKESKIMESAMKTWDTVKCNSVENKEQCKTSVIVMFARIKKDKNICNQLTTSSLKESCKDTVILDSVDKVTLEVCKKLSNKESCISWLITKSTDINICNELNEQAKGMCVEQIGMKAAKKALDVSKCDILSDMQKIICISDIVLLQAKKWEDKCSLLKDNFEKDQCFQTLAIARWIKWNKITACDYLKEDWTKQDCKKQVITSLNKHNWGTNACNLYDDVLEQFRCKDDAKYMGGMNIMWWNDFCQKVSVELQNECYSLIN